MLRRKNLKSEFLKSVVVLTTGTVLAQAVSYLAMLILTRVYTDVEFGEWGIYMRIVAFVTAIATARYEASIPLPKFDGHGYLLYKASLRIGAMVLTATTITFAVYLLIVPSGWYGITFAACTVGSIAFVILINLGTNWSIRTKAFKAISRQQVVNSVSANIFRVGLGYMGFGALGLIFGTFIGYIISSVWFVRDFLTLTREKFNKYSRKKTGVLLKEHKAFPIINLPHVTMDLGRDLLVAALIVYFFEKDIFGQYNHSYLILRLPLAVVGIAVGRVFYQRCLELVNEGKSVVPLLKKTLRTLILLSVLPFLIIYLFGQPMFEFVFGANWGKSGSYSEIMSIWYMMLFLAAPLSSLPLVLRRQREFFIIGLFGSLNQLIGFGVLPLLWGTSQESWITILWCVSIAQAIYFIIVCLLTIYYAKKGVKGTES